MVRDGLRTLACAGLLLGAASLAPADDADKDALSATLAVQTALQQGRDLVNRRDYEHAVRVLEAQLARINGNREYLATLREAYRGHVIELRLANQAQMAERYVQRLLILDPGAGLDASLRPAAAPEKPTATTPARSGPTLKARAKNDDKADDPFRKDNFAKKKDEKSSLDLAEEEFGNRRYDAASRLYEQAYRADLGLSPAARERWAYCKMCQVVEQLNKKPAAGAAPAELEKEVRLAMSMAQGPQLQTFGKELLGKIQERAAPRAQETPPAAVTHQPGKQGAWSVAETANFRVFHNQPREFAEKVAQVAEATRSAMGRKWFGDAGPDWKPRCDVYLYATAEDYSRDRGVPPNSPGHSTVRVEGGRVLERRIDLHCDEAGLQIAVLPHEATHVVLAGRFGTHFVPRWADEGMAVLTEPRDRVERHLNTLPRHRQEGVLFGVKQLVQLEDYPDPRFIGPFYAQSVSLVDFLSGEKGPLVFTQFLRDGLQGGYEAALKKHYGFRDFNELEQRWRAHAFRDGSTAAKAAER